jgi:hypothetical protein
MLPSITAQPRQKLTKEQSAFNKLTKKIEKLQREIKEEREGMELLLGYYSTEVYPLEQQLLSRHREILPILYDYMNQSKAMTKSELKTLRSIVSGILDRILSGTSQEPDEKTKEIFREINKVSYEQAVDESFEESKAEMEDMYRAMGFKVDLDDINPNDSEEEVMRKMAEKHKKMDQQKQTRDAQKSTRKKTPRQIETEQRELAKEELKKKNLSTVYRQLVKAIHPDLEQDETLRQEKEKIMAQLTIAYQNNDLSTLLLLEMQWLQKEANHLSTLSAEKLQLYNQILKEQAIELERELHGVMTDMRFEPLERFSHPVYGVDSETLRQVKTYLTGSCKTITYSISRLKTHDAAAEVKDIINNYKAGLKNLREDDLTDFSI